MDIGSITPASISASKLENTQLKAQVAVAKKSNEQAEIAGTIVQDAVATVSEPGKGEKLNTVA